MKLKDVPGAIYSRYAGNYQFHCERKCHGADDCPVARGMVRAEIRFSLTSRNNDWKTDILPYAREVAGEVAGRIANAAFNQCADTSSNKQAPLVEHTTRGGRQSNDVRLAMCKVGYEPIGQVNSLGTADYYESDTVEVSGIDIS